MTAFSSLPASEQARQLANPDGPTGLAVAEWLNDNNRQANAKVIAALGLQSGCSVLEIGCGNGRAARDIVGRAADIRYVGIDISATMVDEANRFNAALVDTGRVSFHLASAEHMPFADASFDRAFAIGVIHFWIGPIVPLNEIRRVMRPGCFAIMGALDSRSPPEFARPEFGFYLRSGAEWDTLYREAGFSDVNAQSMESDQITPDGVPTKRYSIRVTARS